MKILVLAFALAAAMFAADAPKKVCYYGGIFSEGATVCMYQIDKNANPRVHKCECNKKDDCNWLLVHNEAECNLKKY